MQLPQFPAEFPLSAWCSPQPLLFRSSVPLPAVLRGSHRVLLLALNRGCLVPNHFLSTELELRCRLRVPPAFCLSLTEASVAQ
jgi:hypothetical protein